MLHYMDRSTHPLPPLVGTFPDATPPGQA